MRVPWAAMRSNQSIPKKINPEYSLAGQMLKLKLQYFGYLTRRADLLEKTLMQIEGKMRDVSPPCDPVVIFYFIFVVVVVQSLSRVQPFANP